MTFLELAQMTARESGTVSGTLPIAVTGQTGRLLKIVNWVITAWNNIQNSRNAWRWMRAEFSGTATAGSKRYTAASWSLSRMAEWITEEDTVTVYLQSAGVSDESPLLYMEWSLWKRTYDRGAQEQNRPLHYTISPANEFCIGPTPDDTYVIRGEYRKTPQTLAANADTPEMPARFHELVAWEALLLLAEHDEGNLHIAVATRRKRELMGDLMRDQLPGVHIGAGGLA